ncbi:MAG: hypothetical protein ACOY90_07945 [Candidatus Zhuqueibacterota bacterium]
MKNRRDILHHEIAAFLNGDSDFSAQESIRKIREGNPLYQLLFELIENASPPADAEAQPARTNLPDASFSQVEQLLERLFTGNFSAGDARQFRHGLIHSPLFYKRVLDQLQRALPELSPEPDADLAHVELKDNEAILRDILNAREQAGPEAMTNALRPAESWRHRFESLRDSLKIPRLSPRFALLISAVSTAVILFLLSYDSLFQRNDYSRFLSETRIPYEYDSSTFRGVDQDIEATRDPLLFAFIRDFKNGVGYYTIQEYESAIYIFENLEATMADLETKKVAPEFTPYFRDLYFYNGLSHLALYSKKETKKKVRAKHLQEAISSLQQADAVNSKYRLNGLDRVVYYLGLAYGLNGQRELAANQLAAITAESQFFSDTQALLKKWGKK